MLILFLLALLLPAKDYPPIPKNPDPNTCYPMHGPIFRTWCAPGATCKKTPKEKREEVAERKKTYWYLPGPIVWFQSEEDCKQFVAHPVPLSGE